MPRSLSEGETAERAYEVEGPSIGLLHRAAGLVWFLLINPFMIAIWFADPKFVAGPIDLPEISIALVTIAMELMGVLGLTWQFARTRVTGKTIEWGLFRRQVLEIDRIKEVSRIFSYQGTTLVRLLDENDRKIELSVGTRDLRRAFQEIQAKVAARPRIS